MRTCAALLAALLLTALTSTADPACRPPDLATTGQRYAACAAGKISEVAAWLKDSEAEPSLAVVCGAVHALVNTCAAALTHCFTPQQVKQYQSHLCSFLTKTLFPDRGN